MKKAIFFRKWNFISSFESKLNLLHQTHHTLHRNLSTVQETLTVHNLIMKSCGSVYKNWKENKKFTRVPDGDLIFNVKYFDTAKKNSGTDKLKKVLTVVALHGTPGSCDSFRILTTFLNEKGVRAVVPTFPDFTDYHPGIFRHTDEEKAQYVKDFLSALSISHVDLLVCHSSAVYPALLLCLDQRPTVKSLVLLNTASFSLDAPLLKYWRSFKLMVKASESPHLLKIMDVVCPSLMKIARVPVRIENFLDPLITATAMVNGNLIESKEKFQKLARARFPILYAFSDDDKLTGRDYGYEVAYLLGAKPSDIMHINKDGIKVTEGFEKPTLKVMAFETGSHYSFLKYSNIINEEIYEFLKKHS